MTDYPSVNAIFAYTSVIIAIIAILLNILHQNLREVPALFNERKHLARKFTIMLIVFFIPVMAIIGYPVINTFFMLFDKKEMLFSGILIYYLFVASIYFFIALYDWNRFQRALLKTISGYDIDRIVDEL